MTRSLSGVVLAWALLIAMLPRLAFADEGSARRFFDKGEKEFALGHFAEALTQYQQAFDAQPLPGFLFNIGQCHRNLGDYDAAIFSFRKYLDLEPQAPNREAVETLIKDLEDKQARERAAKFVPPPPPKKKPRPIYKRWWFWTGIGVAAAAGGGAGAYFLTRDHVPGTDLGNINFGK